MNTIRDWLTEKGFDWEKGRILYQESSGYSPGWAAGDELQQPVEITAHHPILDLRFPHGFGAPSCPRFFAKDTDAIYFPGMYDGSTWCVRIPIELDKYITENIPTPYVGGN